MQEYPNKPMPTELSAPATPEMLAASADALVQAFKAQRQPSPNAPKIPPEALKIAEKLVDYCEGGRVNNGHAILPQLTVRTKEGGIAYNAIMDWNQDGLAVPDITAAVLTAADLAARKNIRMADVPVDAEFTNLAKHYVTRVQQADQAECRTK